MRSIISMDVVQLEITNACVLQCANCTRFCGHHKKPYLMELEYFKQAVDSMEGYPKQVGVMGGEPLLHPQFAEMCEYIGSKFDRMQLGLWTTLPAGERFVRHREIIVKTFGNIYINDHSRQDIYHAPLLVSAKEVYAKEYPDDPEEAKRQMWLAIDKCWIQNYWSASINPNGAFFCEVAAAFSILFDGPKGWPVEPGWWKRTPRDYISQMDEYCPGCGAAVSLRRRVSVDERDDVSEDNLAKLQAVGSRKVKQNLYQISDLTIVHDPEKMAAYKDTEWRNQIAGRYGMFLTINQQGFWEPHLKPRWDPTAPVKPSLFDQLVEANR